MDQFVCVRLVKANRLDLSLMQFDYDLTFAVLFMNADRTLYGRYGTRTEMEDAEKDISMNGLAEALKGALKLHEQYPANKSQLVGKQPRPTPYRTPDMLPALRGKYKEGLDYDGQVVRSCLHCHQIRDAKREEYRTAGKPIPDEILFPYPMPTVMGIKLDPDYAAKVKHVNSDSPAARAGVEAGDLILSINDQPILSTADIQWVLHTADSETTLTLALKRESESPTATINLPEGWRRSSDIEWRVTTWPLRRMATGGLVLDSATETERRNVSATSGQMALRITHVGQYGAHAAGKRAGFKKGDIIVSFDGRKDLMTESALLAYAVQNIRAGQKVKVDVVRAGRTLELTLPAQK